MLVAMLALVAIAAAPALADVGQDIGRSGDVSLDSNIVNNGDNSNQCAAPLQIGNTGSLQNAQGFSQTGAQQPQEDTSQADLLNALKDFDFGENFDLGDLANLVDALDSGSGTGSGDGDNSLGDVKFEGASMEFNPEQNVECDQTVSQNAFAVSPG
jgi:hypothetical protein